MTQSSNEKEKLKPLWWFNGSIKDGELKGECSGELELEGLDKERLLTRIQELEQEKEYWRMQHLAANFLINGLMEKVKDDQ